MSTQMQGWHPISSGSPSGAGLLSVNPYRGQNYVKSPWQNFLTSLGFRTQSDAWQENMSVQAAEYDAAIAQKLYDQEYNLPINQVARMRAAGINPDLDGGSGIDSGSAQPLGEDPSTPMQSTGDDFQLANFANSVLSVFSTSLGIVQSMQGVVRGRIQNSLLATENETKFKDFAQSMSLNFLPDKPDSVVDEYGVESSWRDQALGRAKIFARKNLPKKMQDKFLAEVTAFWNGAPATNEAYTTWRNGLEERFQYGVKRGAYGDLTIDDVLYGMTKPFSDYLLREMKGNAEYKAEKAENDAAYQKELDPHLAAEAQNSSNSSAKATNDINATLRGTMSEILSFLKDASSGRGVGAGLAKIAMALLSAQSLQMLPSLSSFVK